MKISAHLRLIAFLVPYLMQSCVEYTPYEMEYTEMAVVINKTVQRKPSVLLADFSISYDIRIKNLQLGVSYAMSKDDVKNANNIAWVQHVGYTHYEMSIDDVPFEVPYYAAVCAVTNKSDTIWSDVVAATMSDFDKENSSLNGHRFVDLGLPSGTLWADCNIGASSPEEEGDRFAWGEVEPKEDGTWETYKYCEGTYKSLTKYNDSQVYGDVQDGLIVLEDNDDAANVLWGEGWSIPTPMYFQELLEYCNLLYEEYPVPGNSFKTKSGFRVVGTNGNEIYLPNDGIISGDYWTKSQEYLGYILSPYNAFEWDQSKSSQRLTTAKRCKNFMIRPICKYSEW